MPQPCQCYSGRGLGLLVAAAALVFAVSWLVLHAGSALMARVGESGAQLVLNGVM